ncbi:MAG: ATP-binding protein, partial [Rubrivivax sp.]|nr:ATP-binding protein [Rubrivivax sp.]
LEAAAATALNRLERRYRVDRVHLGDSLRGLTVRALIDDVVSMVALLIENAIEATAAGGRVDLAARLDGDWVELKVRDDGEGMTAEVAARASEPFFTARGPRHAGIGLSAVDGMVERHGGTWWIDSAPGAGCCVTVRLPAWREQG